MRIAIRPKWLRWSFVLLLVIFCLHIFYSAVTQFSTPAWPRRRVPPTRNVGGRSAYRQTRILSDPCLHCNSDRSACSKRYSAARMGIRSTIRAGVRAKFDLTHVAPRPAFCHTRNKTRLWVFFIAGHSRVPVTQAKDGSLLREQDVARPKERQSSQLNGNVALISYIGPRGRKVDPVPGELLFRP
jgi:hypothetical protein